MAVMPCPNPHCRAMLPANARACPGCGIPLHGVLFLGRYSVQTLVERGEVTFTYLAHDQQADEPVELRVLVHPDPEARALLVAEASAIRRLGIEGTQRVRDVLNDDPCAVVLDAPAHRSGREFAPLSDAGLRPVALQAAQILDELHHHAVLHRAMHPDHLRLDEAGHVTLTGWGWERWLAAVLGLSLPASAREHGDYVAPEAIGEKGTASADLYALGVTLMVLATHKEPAELFDYESQSYQWRHVAGLEPELAEVIDALLRQKPGDRPSSAQVLVQQLAALTPNEPAEAAELPAAPEALKPPEPAAARHRARWPWAILVLSLFWPAWPLSDPPPPTPKSRMRLVAMLPEAKATPSPTPVPRLHRPAEPRWVAAPPTPPPRLTLGLRRAAASPAPSRPSARALAATASALPSSPLASGAVVPGGVASAVRYLVQRPGPLVPPTTPVASGEVEIRVSRLFHSLELYQGSMRLLSFPVALGANGSTPVGSFPVVAKALNPSYRSRDGAIVSGGHADNPLGDRWIGLQVTGRSGIGIHGTNDPLSIGGDYSQGCIRMRNEDVEVLYEAIGLGARVVIEP